MNPNHRSVKYKIADARLFDEIQSENRELLNQINESYIEIETTKVNDFLNN